MNGACEPGEVAEGTEDAELGVVADRSRDEIDEGAPHQLKDFLA